MLWNLKDRCEVDNDDIVVLEFNLSDGMLMTINNSENLLLFSLMIGRYGIAFSAILLLQIQPGEKMFWS